MFIRLLLDRFSIEHHRHLERQPWYNLIVTISFTMSAFSIFKIVLIVFFKLYYAMPKVITLESVLEMSTYAISNAYVINLVLFQFESLFNLGPLLLVLNWTVVILFIEKFLIFGIFALMLKKILIQSMKIMPLLVIVLMGFSFGLAIIKQQRIQINSVFESFLTTMETMIDLSSDDEFKKTYSAGIVFFLFMVMICLVLLNLFVGKSLLLNQIVFYYFN